MKNRHIVKRMIKRIDSQRIMLQILFLSFFYYCFGYVTLLGFYGIGDICYELSFISSYKSLINKKIRVISTKNRKKIFLHFNDIDKFSCISTRIENFILYGRGQLFDNKISFIKDVAHYKLSGTNIFEKIRSLFNVSPLAIMTFPKPYCTGSLPTIPKKAVFINLKSNWYHSALICDYIKKISVVLENKGFSLFVNGKKESDFVTNNATYVFYSLNELLCVASSFEAIISIRTGLLDFLINSNSKIYCFYESRNDYLINSGFSLFNWNGNSSVKELFIDQLNNNEFVCSIVDEL